MKKIVFTQRVEVIESYGERRDCADQHITDFIYVCGYLPVPIPNRSEVLDTFLNVIKPDGIFFSGGNDLVSYGGNAPERDEIERLMIKYSEMHDTPLFGICRGMQLIATYYGASLEKVEGHVRVDHRVNGRINRDAVNSFHGLGIKKVTSPLKELCRSEDGVIEAIQHEKFKIAAVMWHPERVDGFLKEDINMVSRFYEGGRLG